MRDTTTETAPTRIWLQVDTDPRTDDRDETFPNDFGGVTWQDEEIGGLEVEYVRADIVRAAMPVSARDEVNPELQRLAEALGMTANSESSAAPRSGVG